MTDAVLDDQTRRAPSRAVHVGIVSLLICAGWVAFVAASLGGPERALAFGSTVSTSSLAAEHFGDDVFLNDKGYDGQYYWAIATQLPDLEGASDDVGYPRYRFQRIVTPLLASPFGDGVGAAIALLAVGVGGAALAAGSVADLAERHGRPAWVGYFVLPPLAFSLSFGLAEPLAYGVALLGVALVDRRRWWWAAAAFAVAGLTRESSLLLVFGSAAGVLLARQATVRQLAPLVVPVTAVGAWWFLIGLSFEGGVPDEGELGLGGIVDAGPTGIALGIATLVLGLVGAWLWRDVPTVWPLALGFGLLVLAYEGSLFNWQVIYRANLPAWTFGLAGLTLLLTGWRASAAGGRGTADPQAVTTST